MKLYIKIKSTIRVLEADAQGIIPSNEELKFFSEPMEMKDQTTATLEDFGEVVELSYPEQDAETGAYYQRTLRYDKTANLLTITREGWESQIEIEQGVMRKNVYLIEDVGETSLETYGIALNWSSPKTDILLDYYSKIGGTWTWITIEITGNEA